MGKPGSSWGGAPAESFPLRRERSRPDAPHPEDLPGGVLVRHIATRSQPGLGASLRSLGRHTNSCRRQKKMFRNKNTLGPWSCPKCGSHNVELREPATGHPLLDKLRDWLAPRAPGPQAQWGEKRLVCRDCGHVWVLHIM